MKDYAELLEELKLMTRQLNQLFANKEYAKAETLAREAILVANDLYVIAMKAGR